MTGLTFPVMASKVLAAFGERRIGVIVNEHTLDAAETRHHVDVLGRTFEFIHHDDLVDCIEHPRPRPFCLLTFDDGKRIDYTGSAPELERLGVPAVFYVTTGFIGGTEPLWFDRYEALQAAMPALPAGLDLHTLRTLPLHVVEERLDRACARLEVTVDLEDDRVAPMGWPQARDLAARGFTIGAHGVRHAVLTCEPEADALREIGRSIADVAREIGAPCRTFAFPNGNYTATLARHAMTCGVLTVMTTDPTWVEPGARVWRLPRIQLFGSQSTRRMDMKLTAASAHLLANPDGTGRRYWQARG